MGLVLTQEGARVLWNSIFDFTAMPPYFLLHLLGDPYQPVHTSTLAILGTHELAVGGYSPLPVVTDPVAGPTVVIIPQGGQLIAVVGPYPLAEVVTIYGYYLSYQGSSVWAEHWTTPFAFDPVNGPFYVTLLPWLISIP
jgi:hypothetical protein